MKAKLFSYITVFFTVTLVILNTIYLQSEISSFCQEIENFDTKADDALSRGIALKEKFEQREIFISLTVSHDDLTNIEEGFSELVGALSVDEKEEAEIIKNRLKNSFEHLRRLSGFNLDAII